MQPDAGHIVLLIVLLTLTLTGMYSRRRMWEEQNQLDEALGNCHEIMDSILARKGDGGDANRL